MMMGAKARGYERPSDDCNTMMMVVPYEYRARCVWGWDMRGAAFVCRKSQRYRFVPVLFLKKSKTETPKPSRD